MPSSISASQKENIDYISQLGQDINLTEVVQDALTDAAAFLIVKITDKIKKYQLVNTGGLSSNIKQELVGTNQVNIKMPYYYDFLNKGVKGAKSKKPASSPYSFKDSFSMSPEGRASIKSLIDNGRASVSVVKPGKEVGLERKRRSVADMKLDTLIYAIKSGGIKKRPYLDEALAENSDEVAAIISKAFAKEVILSIKPK